MNKLIIEFDDKIRLTDAINRVLTVVSKGRISKARNIPHFCWHTTFTDGSAVSVRQKRTAKSADSFVVRMEETA